MSLEQKLKMEYKKQAERVEVSKSLDTKILHLFDEHRNSNKSRGSIFRGPKLVIAVLTFMLLVGFGYAGSQLLSSINMGDAIIEVSKDKHLDLEEVSPDQIRKDIQYVKEQLQAGESALVYISEFKKEKHRFYNELPGFIVTNPLIEKDYDESLKLLETEFSNVHHPEKLLRSYSFAGAFKGSPLEGGKLLEDLEVFNVLSEKAKKENKRMLWEKLNARDPIIPAYTLIYSIPQGGNIYLTLEKIPNTKAKLKMAISEATTFEEVTINDQKGYYFKNPEQFLIPTGEYQEMKWIKKLGDETIIYSLASDTLTLSKDELMLIVKEVDR
jgi:hypothetical protein